MLDSVKISRRQSEIRQELAGLVGKPAPTEDETRSMGALDAEYRTNETRYRAALIAEDQERREAGEELETRGEAEFRNLVAGFELRQAALALDEGRALSGRTAEVVQELRAAGGYRGVPVPWEALERRAGETVASGTPDPIRTMPIIDRLFPASVSARMGGQMINIGTGRAEYPVTSSSVAAGWAATETGNVAGPTVYATTDRPLAPDYTLGIQLRLTRKALQQSGDGLEQAVRRDMSAAVEQALDAGVFLGSGASGQPEGILAGAAGWGVNVEEIDATASWAIFRAEVVAFMIGNAASGPGDVRALIRPEVYNTLDGLLVGDGGFKFEYDRLAEHLGSIVMTTNGLAAPAGDPLATTAILSTTAGGVPPFYVGAWGAIDLIRDPFSDAQSGALRLTALATMDVTISRAAQLRIMNGIR